MNFLKNTLFPVLFVILLCLLFGEVALRAISLKKKITIIETLKYANQFRPTPKKENMYPRHYRNKEGVIMGLPFRTNELGLRGEALGAKKDNEKRVLVVGGSVALGWGTPEEETFARFVEEGFRGRGRDSVRVVNGGIANTNTEYQYFVLKDLIPQVKPDHVVLHYFLYDSRVESSVAKNKILKHSFIGTYLYSWYLRLQHSWSSTGTLSSYFQNLYDEKSSSWRRTQSYIKKMKALCLSKNIPFTVMIYPELHDVSQEAPALSVFLKIEQKLEELGVRYISGLHKPLKSYVGRERELWVSPTDPHGNSIVHKVMADAFLDKLARVK